MGNTRPVWMSESPMSESHRYTHVLMIKCRSDSTHARHSHFWAKGGWTKYWHFCFIKKCQVSANISIFYHFPSRDINLEDMVWGGGGVDNQREGDNRDGESAPNVLLPQMCSPHFFVLQPLGTSKDNSHRTLALWSCVKMTLVPPSIWANSLKCRTDGTTFLNFFSSKLGVLQLVRIPWTISFRPLSRAISNKTLSRSFSRPVA